MLNPAPKGHKVYEMAAEMIGSGSSEKVTQYLVAFGEKKGAKAQAVFALTLQKVADDLRGINHVPCLADEIIGQQAQKVQRYGDKAFLLSEKQIAVIARDVI